jgi:perosamine synthetase
MNWKIPLFKTYSDQDDVDAVSKIILEGKNWAVGPEIKQFEEEIADFVGTKYALAFNSGTSALHVLLLACDVKGKEVIVPSFTFVATSNAVILAGGIPVFAESEPETFGLDAEDVKKRITEKTKAIVPIHFGGCACRDIEKLVQICKENNLLLLDDAAESLGAEANGKKVGTFGEAAMFSFCQNKIISCGEGGVIVTDNQESYEKMKLLRSLGRIEEVEGDYFSSTKDCDYLEAGFNFRMPTMNAALGISQLRKVNFLTHERKKNAAFLNQELSLIPEIKCPIPPIGFNHLYQMYTITLPNKQIRDQLQLFLESKMIMSKVYFNPVHLKTLYKVGYNFKEGDLPLTEELSSKVLTLPMSATLREEDLQYLSSSIKEFFNK